MGERQLEMPFWRILAIIGFFIHATHAQDISQVSNDQLSFDGKDLELYQDGVSSPPIDKRMDLLNFFLSGGSNNNNDQSPQSGNQEAILPRQQSPIVQVQQPNPGSVVLVREAQFPNPNGGGLLSRLILLRREARLRRWARRLQILPLLFGLRQIQVQPAESSQSQVQLQQVPQRQIQPEQPQQRAVLLLTNRNGDIIPNYNPADVMNRPLVYANDGNTKQKPAEDQKPTQYSQSGSVYDDNSAQNSGNTRSLPYSNNQYSQNYAPRPSQDEAERQRQYNNDIISSEYGNIRILPPQTNDKHIQKYGSEKNSADGNILIFNGGGQSNYNADGQQDYQNLPQIIRPLNQPTAPQYQTQSQNDNFNIPLLIGGGEQDVVPRESYKESNQHALLLSALQEQLQQQAEGQKIPALDRTIGGGINGYSGGGGVKSGGGATSPITIKATLQKPVLPKGGILPKPILNVNGKLFFGAELGKDAAVTGR